MEKNLNTDLLFNLEEFNIEQNGKNANLLDKIKTNWGETGYENFIVYATFHYTLHISTNYESAAFSSYYPQ